MLPQQLQRYFEDYTYIKKGHYPVTDMLVYWYMGDVWSSKHQEEQIAISEALLRAIEAQNYALTREDVEKLFELYELRKVVNQGTIVDADLLQQAFTKIIETYQLSH